LKSIKCIVYTKSTYQRALTAHEGQKGKSINVNN
jgi:hypothetical protein